MEIVSINTKCFCVREAWEEESERDGVLHHTKGWVNKAKVKAKVHCIRKYDKSKTGWHSLPQELVDRILDLALTEDARVHELIPDKKQRRREYRGAANRMVLRSNNSKFVPKMLHVCREWREMALRQYRLCQHTPIWPHPDWQRGQPCLKIKPFWYNPRKDSLYFRRMTGEWLAFVWARTDTFWIDGLLDGWHHVGLDIRCPSWMGLTHYLPQAGSVFTNPPAIKFRAMLPDLKRLSLVIDYSALNCPTPFANNTAFENSTMPLNQDGTLFQGLPGPRQWKRYLQTEYSDAERPEVDVQGVARKKERAIFWDKWIRFYVHQCL